MAQPDVCLALPAPGLRPWQRCPSPPAAAAVPAAGHVSANPQLRCIALLDTADPGFPSFLALHASHMEAFGGRLLPPAFEACNQGGDPFLFELWRSFGRAGVCAKVRVTNGIGEYSIVG